ncbi:sugar-binding domain-containing protein [Enterococcus avium]
MEIYFRRRNSAAEKRARHRRYRQYDFYCRRHPLKKGFSQRLLGIELQDIKKIPQVVIVATGKEKAESVQTLLKMNFITDLVIDEEIAELL